MNHVAVAIAAAKLVRGTPDTVVQRARRLIAAHRESATLPRGRFWEMAFHPRTMTDLAALRAGLLVSRHDATAVLLRALALGVLHGPLTKGEPSYFSNQMPRTYATKPAPAVKYWERTQTRAPAVEVLDLLERRAKYVLSEQPNVAGGRVLCGDVRRVLRTSAQTGFTHIITSPPYLGMRSYLPDQWLRSWFLGGSPAPQYRLPGAVATADPRRFATELGAVWRTVARTSVTGARLIVRLGSLPSSDHDPLRMLEASMSHASCGWERVGARSVPVLPKRSRQAEQFGLDLGSPLTEVDAEYVLSSR